MKKGEKHQLESVPEIFPVFDNSLVDSPIIHPLLATPSNTHFCSLGSHATLAQGNGVVLQHERQRVAAGVKWGSINLQIPVL